MPRIELYLPDDIARALSAAAPDADLAAEIRRVIDRALAADRPHAPPPPPERLRGRRPLRVFLTADDISTARTAAMRRTREDG